MLQTLYPYEALWTTQAGGTLADWTSASGGLVRVDINHGGREVQDRTGGQQYSAFTVVVDKYLSCRVYLRDLSQIYAMNTKGPLVFTLLGKTGQLRYLTLIGMVLTSTEPGQPRGEPGTIALAFSHESADGTTMPLSAS